MLKDDATVSVELLENGKIRIQTIEGSITTDEAGLMELSRILSRQPMGENEDEDIVGVFVPFLVESQIGNEGIPADSKEYERKVTYNFFLNSLGSLLQHALYVPPDDLPGGIEIDSNI